MPEFPILLLIVGVGGVVWIAVSWLSRYLERTDAQITTLIDANRARPRPGMEQRDDTLLRQMEQRARARRRSP